MTSDFSLTRLYRRLWSAILCKGPITAIIQLVELALLKCFPGLYLAGDACNISLFIYMAISWIYKEFCSVLSAMQASGDVMPDECRLFCSVTPSDNK